MMDTKKNRRLIPVPSLPPDFLLITCLVASAIFLGAGLFVNMAPWLINLSFIAAVLVAGYDVAMDAVMKLVRERDFDQNLLIIIAAIAAFLIGKGAEGAAVMLLFRVGQYVEEKTAERATNAIEGLLDQRPDTVSAVISGAIVRRAVGKIKEGDIISLAPGERLALDGVVVRGASEVDASALTGQSEPIPVSHNSAVLSGSVNLTGALNIRVTAEFDNSTVSRILRLVEKAEDRKSKPEKMITKLAKIFTPAVALAALVVGVAVPFFSGLPYVPWLYRAAGFLVASYPYALIISIPLAYFAGICGATRKGILFKGASIVDALARTTSVVFDKTGILTTGRFQVADVNSYEISNDRLLMLAAYAEAQSDHPIARAIIVRAGIVPDMSKITRYRELPGRGTEVEIGGITVTAGNARFMTELGITPDISQNEASAVYIAVNGKYAGRILLADAMKQDAKKTVKELRELGIDRVALFTGDKSEVAADVAGQLGIAEYYAECLPEDKVRRLGGLNDMQLPGDMLIFVGDGQSDGPALRTADVGVSMGGFGADEAVEAADVLIMTDKPSKITEAIALARQTNQIVRQNILLSLVLKGLILLLILLFAMPIWLVAFADAGVAVLALINARRAFGMRGRDIKKALADTGEPVADEDAFEGADKVKMGKE